ncbi:protein DBF4 homolog A [Anomaloglossus baeobatrachus]|uniref:protein DBF4 homolog A n=1 Tax=Anomaloglossus baeobatrachus TaxID=238106 RepID=UPI003F4F7467
MCNRWILGAALRVERREIGGEIKSRSHREISELAQSRQESTGKPESRPGVGQSGRLLPSPAIPKASAVTLGSTMQRSKGGTQGRGVKMKPGQPTAKKLPNKGPKQKPFTGKVFYLDITSRVVAEKLEKDIKELGGTVEGFLSKEISCLITSKKEAKCAKSLKYQCSMPSPEPASGSSSARPSGHRGDCRDGGKKPEKKDVSRGKSLLKKVINEQEIISKNSILASALNWGVRILHLDEAKTYIDQKKRLLLPVEKKEKSEFLTKYLEKRVVRRNAKAQKLKGPFLKLEDSSCQYRPIFLVLPFFRSFQSSCKQCRPVAKKPVASKKPVAAQKGTKTKQNLNKTWHGQNEGNITPKLDEPKKHGYCECCLQKYEDLRAHLASQKHKNYSLGPYYQDVDNLITSFEFDFIDWSKCRQETQGSGLFIPAGNVRQDENVFSPQRNHIIPKLSYERKLGTGVSNKEMASAKLPDVTCSLVSNLACLSEPLFTIPCPPQSLCSVTCVTDSFSKLPSSQVVTPTHENVFPTQTPNISPYHNENTQKDLHPKENERELSETSPNDQNCFSDPVNSCPGKRLKLDTVDTDNVSAAPTMGITEPCEDLEKRCSLHQADTLCHVPHSSPTGKLHRKVKQLARRARKQEELPCTLSSKVSVPVEECAVSASKDILAYLFQSSDEESEFYGFSSDSMDSLPCIKDAQEQPSSHGHVLWSLFSNTSSSASTFYGF